MANKRGRKPLYETHVKPYFSMISEMCRTMNETQIAEALGVGASTFQYYKTQYPELKECLKKGRQNLVADLRSALIKKAIGYEYTEKKVTTEKVDWPDELYNTLLDAGFSANEIAKSTLVKTEICHKYMSPDVAAINLALKNYDKDNWANDPQMLEIRKRELELRKQQIENNSW